MKANWILALVCAAIFFGVIVAVGVIGAYGYYLGPISRIATDWGSFGSVMSGAFTLLSSFATIGTLLFLYLQQIKGDERQAAQDAGNFIKQEKHDIVVEKQLAALTFEQYLNHRKVFFERLHEQADFFKRNINFPNPERIYTAIFPKNSPSHCEYKVVTGGAEPVKARDLTDCQHIYVSITGLLDDYSDMEKHLQLIQKIFHLQGCLGIDYVAEPREGDIFFLKYNTGINIYEFSKALYRLECVFNSILFYTGNEGVSQIHHKGQGTLLRDGIYKTLSEYHRAQGAIEIWHEIEALPFLHKIYEVSQCSLIVAEGDLRETYVCLSEIFESSEKTQQLKNFDFADRLTDVILYEINGAKQRFSKDLDKINLLNFADRCLWSAMDYLKVTR